MIGRIEGHIVEIADNVVLVAVGGVGYELEVSAAALAQAASLPGADQAMTFYTHFVVREDAQQLYGFVSRGERDLFRDLIRISGVGPKLAISLISSISLHELVEAVEIRDVTALTRIPGVGKKTAERLLVELSGKLPTVTISEVRRPGQSDRGAALEAERALVALGYRPPEAARAVEAVRAQQDARGATAELTAEELVRAALRQLARAAEGTA